MANRQTDGQTDGRIDTQAGGRGPCGQRGPCPHRGRLRLARTEHGRTVSRPRADGQADGPNGFVKQPDEGLAGKKLIIMFSPERSMK